MQLRRYDAVCLGLLVADLFVSPMARLPAAGELLTVDDIQFDIGGCAANTGITLSKLGHKVGLIGKVGQDVFGGFVIQAAAEQGLDVQGIRAANGLPTSKTVILPVESEDRRYIHTFGANADLDLQDIDTGLVAQSRLLCVGGYLALPKLDPRSLRLLFEFARQHGIITVLDVVVPANFGHESDLADSLSGVLPYTNVFLPNEDEASRLTGESEPQRQAQAFLAYGCQTVVITMGQNGALVRTQRDGFQAPAFPVRAIDFSGAGDAFAAGFAHGLLEGWQLPQVLEFASAIGASACTQLGCTAGVLSVPEATAFLAGNHLPIVHQEFA